MINQIFIRTSNYKLINITHIKSLEIKREGIRICIIATDVNNKDHIVSEHNSYTEAQEHIDKMCEFYDIFAFKNYGG